MATTIKWEIDIDGDAVSVNAYPLAEARRLVEEHRGYGYLCDLAPDGEDPKLAWVWFRVCGCACGCRELATTTDDSGMPCCGECVNYYCDPDGQPVCSRVQDDKTCRHCGGAIKWGPIVTGRAGTSNRQHGSCACGEIWTLTERGGDWELSETHSDD